MATWASLTAEEKNIVQTNDTMLRSAIGAYARALKDLETCKTHYDASASAIVATLDASEVIPSASGLAGITSADETFFATVHSSVATTLANDYTVSDQQNYVTLAGPLNV
jgi:hypothetical protein